MSASFVKNRTFSLYLGWKLVSEIVSNFRFTGAASLLKQKFAFRRTLPLIFSIQSQCLFSVSWRRSTDIPKVVIGRLWYDILSITSNSERLITAQEIAIQTKFQQWCCEFGGVSLASWRMIIPKMLVPPETKTFRFAWKSGGGGNHI